MDKKVSHEHLALTLPKRDVVVFKMHGDIDSPDQAVLTKGDYDCYDQTRSLFSDQLKGDLLSKTFIFLGLSFTDPNIGYILGRVRSILGKNLRNHYWITRDASASGNATDLDKSRQRHRIEDLKTYGIQTVLVSDYTDITGLLRELNKRVHRQNVFVSGSAHDYAPLGETRALQLLRRVGSSLIDSGFNLVSGMGIGVGDAVSMGAIEAVYRREGEHLEERTILRPFPQVEPSRGDRASVWNRYRREMLERSGAAIFVLGNKLDATASTVVSADGVREEFQIARELGVYPIPIGISGHIAKDIHAEVLSCLDECFGTHATKVRPFLTVLGDASADDGRIIDSVLDILKCVAPK